MPVADSDEACVISLSLCFVQLPVRMSPLVAAVRLRQTSSLAGMVSPLAQQGLSAPTARSAFTTLQGFFSSESLKQNIERGPKGNKR